MRPQFSIVVPVYNEAGYLPEALPRLLADLEGLGVSYRLTIVENGSTDATAAIARKLTAGAPVTVMSLEAADYGAAMREGFLVAEGEWVVNFDIDYFSADFLHRVMATTDADLVIGSKRDPGSVDRRPVVRRLATLVFNLLLRVILGSNVSDTHGMKAFRWDLIQKLAPVVTSTQDLYDTELVIRAERAGYGIVDVPVLVEELRSARSTLVRRVPRTIRGLMRIRAELAREEA